MVRLAAARILPTAQVQIGRVLVGGKLCANVSAEIRKNREPQPRRGSDRQAGLAPPERCARSADGISQAPGTTRTSNPAAFALAIPTGESSTTKGFFAPTRRAASK